MKLFVCNLLVSIYIIYIYILLDDRVSLATINSCFLFVKKQVLIVARLTQSTSNINVYIYKYIIYIYIIYIFIIYIYISSKNN